MTFFESFLVWMHVLLFVYWLGGDLGVFYSSRFRNSPEYDAKTRALIAKITANVDMAPRTTMVLMIPTGFSLVAVNGLWSSNLDWFLTLIWLFSACWLFLVWWLHLTKDLEKKKPWAKFDLSIRWLLFLVLSLSGIISLIQNFAGMSTIYSEQWISLKILLFSLTIFCGIMIRVSAKPYIQAFQEMLKDGSTPELEQRINKSAAAARRWVKLIWLLISLAAFIGIWKPIF